MPKVQSSSKSETKLVLFATERRHIQETRFVLDWITQHSPDAKLADKCQSVSSDLMDVLMAFPETAKTAK